MIPIVNVIPNVMRSGYPPVDITWYLRIKNFPVHLSRFEIGQKKSLMLSMMIKVFKI